mmetsp:Transcript_35004/g.99218  ORF Transcript_35004/g.99218 Transcript_35004/m.99218 type:complete len:216 (+) Transcript_35004:1099-1746(+)
MAELALQELELLRDALVLLRKLLVLLLEPLVSLRIPVLQPTQDVPLPRNLALLLVDGRLILVVPLHQHTVIVLQLLSVQLVGCPHRLKVLLQVLDICFQPDLQNVVLLGVRYPEVLKGLVVCLGPLLGGFHEVLLHRATFVKQVLHLDLVGSQQLCALLQEGVLNLVELLLEGFLHLMELCGHEVQYHVNILGLLLQHADILIVLALQLRLDLRD